MENTIVYDAVQDVKSSVEYYGGGHKKRTKRSCRT